MGRAPANLEAAKLILPIGNDARTSEAEVQADPRLLALGKAFGIEKIENDNDARMLVVLVRSLIEQMQYFDEYEARADVDKANRKPFTAESIIAKGYGACFEDAVLVSNFLASYGLPYMMVAAGRSYYIDPLLNEPMYVEDTAKPNIIRHSPVVSEVGGNYVVLDASPLLYSNRRKGYVEDGVYSAKSQDVDAVNNMFAAAFSLYVTRYVIKYVPDSVKEVWVGLFAFVPKESVDAEVMKAYQNGDEEMTAKKYIDGAVKKVQSLRSLREGCSSIPEEKQAKMMQEICKGVNVNLVEMLHKTGIAALGADLPVGWQKLKDIEFWNF